MSFTLPLQIPLKHQIAQFIKIEFGDPFIFSLKNPFSILFKRMLTDDVSDKRTTFPSNLDFVTVNLTGNKIGKYISSKNYATEIILLESYFWELIISKVLEDANITRNISESLRNIYTYYKIDEEKYSLDNFQRQLTRKGTRSKFRKIYMKKQNFRRIKESECIEIARDFYIRKIPIRQIAPEYKVSRETIRRIKNKYKNKIISLSKNVPYLCQRINKIDNANFNRFSSLRSLS